ncbi:hypothetical protein NFI96_002269 [Prochilodus magdalenae]|nr:hypothetical protein NFI96_002269 [Prochilodus magdalenae]
MMRSKVNTAVYQDVLKHFMLPAADQLYGDADFIFQQDLAPAHSAKATSTWFKDHARTFNITVKCMQDTAAFLMELENDKPEEYAVQMYDAFGKLGSDVVGGNVNRAGSLQECMSVKGPSFRGQYCQVFLKQEAAEYFVGICVPDSCDEEEVRALVVYQAFEQGRSSLIPPVPALLISDPTLGIFMTQCISNSSTADLSTVICLCACVLMIALPLTGSIYVVVVSQRRQREVRPGVESALLSKNNQYGALLANGSPNHSKECISLRDTIAERESNGEREQEGSTMSKSCTGVSAVFFSADNEKRWRQAVQNSPLYVFAFSGPVYLAVDTFLLLGGLLSAKSLLTSIQRAYESYFQYYYNKPYTRYGPYLLGILAGLYMATKKEALIKQQWQAATGWLLSLSVMALLVGLAYLLRDVPAQASVAHAVYQGLHRSLWALAVIWIILACEEGYGGFVNKILSLRVWLPLSNISFACYLIHPILILIYNGKQETPIHYTDLNFLYLFLGHMVLTVVLGFALTVLIEKPYLFLRKAKA